MIGCSVSGSNDQQNIRSEESSAEEERKWVGCFQELKRYRIEHENCNVPRSYGKGLEVWVDKQRRDYGFLVIGRASSMTSECVEKLESIGFEWCDDDSLRVMWDNEDNFRRWIEIRFQELQSYKAKHGHCNVPTTSTALGLWVSLQRPQYWLAKRGKRSCMNGWLVKNSSQSVLSGRIVPHHKLVSSCLGHSWRFNGLLLVLIIEHVNGKVNARNFNLIRPSMGIATCPQGREH